MTILTSPSGKRMLGYVAPVYDQSKIMQAIFEANGQEIDDLQEWVDGIRDQIFPQSATWGLKYWEQLLGIPTDESKPINERRSVVASKMVVKATPTPKMVRELAAFYENGTITITNGPLPNHVKIKFTGLYGSPPNLDDFQAALAAVIPAHLHVVYEYTYLRINQIHNVKTITDMQATPLNQLAPFV